jgi:hypothetical protein
MKKFNEYYIDTKLDILISEGVSNGYNEDIISEKISDILLKEMGPMMSDPTMMNRFDGGAVSNAISNPEYVNNALDAAGVFPPEGPWGLIKDWIAGFFKEQGQDVFLTSFKWLAGAGLSIIAVKSVAKLIEKVLKNINDKSEKDAANADAQGEATFNSSVEAAIKRGDALTNKEKQELVDNISKKLNEKYPKRNKAWWVKALNSIVGGLKGKSGVGLALLGYAFL